MYLGDGVTEIATINYENGKMTLIPFDKLCYPKEMRQYEKLLCGKRIIEGYGVSTSPRFSRDHFDVTLNMLTEMNAEIEIICSGRNGLMLKGKFDKL